MFVTSGCAAVNDLMIKWTPSIYTEENINTNDNITINTEYPVYQPDVEVIYLEITNNTSEEFTFGAEYYIEKKRKDQWYYNHKLQENAAWNDIGYLLPANSSISDKLYVRAYFGPLAEGEYRIIKNVGGTHSAEFTISKDGYSNENLSGYEPLTDLPKEYIEKTIIANGDYYRDFQGHVYNQDSMYEFIKKVSEQIPSKVRMTNFTDEGDPIITDVTYTGEHFTIETDTTRDHFGANEIRKITYSYLTSFNENGTIRLILVNDLSKPFDTGDLTEQNGYVMLWDVSVVSDYDLETLVSNMRTSMNAYQVYSPDGSKSIIYMPDLGNTMIGWNISDSQGGSYGDSTFLSEDRNILQELITMEWLDDEKVLLTFTTTENYPCYITFDVVAEKIIETTYDN
jgi:hypothetical protein